LNNLLIEHENLSIAWAKAFLVLMSPGCEEITPLVVSVTGMKDGRVLEHEGIRSALDEKYGPAGTSCHTVANTIFPKSLWNPAKERALL